MALYLGENLVDLFAGQPVQTVLSTLTATPTTSTQNFLPSSTIDGWNRVTVNPIPSQYIVPSGTVSITSNGTVNVSQYASANVNVPVGSTINNQNKTVIPTELQQQISADNGYTGLGVVTVNAISSSYVGSGISRRSSSDLTISGATVTAPAGYYESSASKTVASGIAGIPSATKGIVSNHSVSITPSVINETGYITGGTKTGTAVSVSASQLVSGTLEIIQNGTKDVTNYASINVNVPSSGGQVLIVDTPDSHGGTIREITAQDTITLQNVKNYTLNSSSAVITPDTGYDGFRSLEVTSSGREDLAEPKDVDFIDYDGRLIYSYTASEFMNLTALPANPVNAGLVAQGWNWTLTDAQDFVSKYSALVIGQNYTTSDGRTRIYITIPATESSVTMQVRFTTTVKNGVRIHWGDGESSLSSQNANTNGAQGSHEYTTSGKYVIELEVISGAISFIGSTGANNNLVNNQFVKATYVNKIEIGDNVTGIGQNPFKRMFNLETISIPTSVTTINDYDEEAFPYGLLRAVVFPINFTTTRYRAMFPSKSSVKYISIPKGMKNIYIDTYPSQLRKLTMYSNEPSSGTKPGVKLYDAPSVTHFVVMGTYTEIVADTVRNSQVHKLFIPDTVTKINATAYAYNYLLEEVHLYASTPPTLTNVNGFSGIPATAIFYVPYSSDHSILTAYQTATNWSTYAGQMQEEPQS